MIVLALALLIGDPQIEAAPPGAVKELQKQLGRGQFTTLNNGQAVSCKVAKSTGDRELDAGFCDGFRACASEVGIDVFAMLPCISRKKDELIMRLASQRAAAAH